MSLPTMSHLVLNILIALAPTQHSEWWPVISDRTTDAVEVIAQEPMLEEAVHEELWSDARAVGAVPLFHAYLNSSIVASGSPPRQITDWWTGLVRDDPGIALHAVLDLDTRYLVWSPHLWSNERYQPLLPAYRFTMMKSLFEAATSLEAVSVDLHEEIAALPELSLAPPNGMPFGVAPESISDPHAREEYESRLEERARRVRLQQRLSDWRNTLARAIADVPTQSRTLYADAIPEEEQLLASMMVAEHWHVTGLGEALLVEWPMLRDRVEDLLEREAQAPPRNDGG